MYLYLETDATLLCIVFVAKRGFDGFDSCSRWAKHYRAGTFPHILGTSQITIDTLSAAVKPELNQIAIYLIGGILFNPLFRICQRESRGFGFILIPKLIKIGRCFRIRLKLLG